MATEPLASTPTPTNEAGELLCPHCDYNLIGSQSPVCPECGEGCNREQLTAWSNARNTEALPWSALDGRPQSNLFAMTFLQPSRLGRLFSPHPDLTGIFWTGLGIRVVSILPASFAMLVVSRGEAAIGMLIAAPGVIGGSLACEYALALLLTWLVTPLAVPPQHRRRFWVALCQSFSTHLITSSCWIAACVFLIAASLPSGGPSTAFSFVLPWLIPGVPILSWWICLSRAIQRRGLPSIGRGVVQIAVPFVGALSLIVGVIISFLSVRMFSF